MDGQERRSPLHDEHLKLKARMVPFAGWQMPVQYSGIIPENQAVRSALGIFDISHMGQFRVTSSTSGQAEQWLDSLLTNSVAQLQDGGGQYTLLLNEAGGVIDDLIVYRMTADHYFLVVNAARIDEDYAWMSQRLVDGITLTNESDDFAAMAIQGPETVEVCRRLFPDSDLCLHDFAWPRSQPTSAMSLCVAQVTRGKTALNCFVLLVKDQLGGSEA